MLKKLVLIILISTNLLCFANDGNYRDTITGNVGSEVVIYFELDAKFLASNNSLKFNISLSNPTVFLPKDFSYNEHNGTIQKENNSTYSATIDFIYNDLAKFEIQGKLLAGNDTIASIHFDDIYLNDTLLSNFAVLIRSNSVGSELPYIRLAKIIAVRPNPIVNKADVSFGIDVKSNCKLYLHSLDGRQFLINDFGTLPAGLHRFTFSAQNYGAGIYYLYLITSSGIHQRKILIIGN